MKRVMEFNNKQALNCLDYSKLARLNEGNLMGQLDAKDTYFIENKKTDTYFIENKKTDTQCFIHFDAINCNLMISFRGSQQFKDWLNDFNAFHLVYPYGNSNSKIKVHKGFITCYKSVRKQIHEIIELYIIDRIKKPLFDVIVTGHSLGGALATLCIVDLQYNYGNYFKHNYGLIGYVSGNPAVFNRAGAKSFNKRLPNFFRTYMRTDWVPNMPPKWFGKRFHGGYCHCGHTNPIGPKSRFHGLIVWWKYLRNLHSLAANITNHSITLYKRYI